MTRELISPLDLFSRLSRDFGSLMQLLSLPELAAESSSAEWCPDVHCTPRCRHRRRLEHLQRWCPFHPLAQSRGCARPIPVERA